jgi:hypothetical protein
MIEVEGMINNQTIAILIDSGASHSYIDPKMVESFHFSRRKHGKSWLVQLATKDKSKVNEMVKSCLMDMNGLNTRVDLNIFPLGYVSTRSHLHIELNAILVPIRLYVTMSNFKEVKLTQTQDNIVLTQKMGPVCTSS